MIIFGGEEDPKFGAIDRAKATDGESPRRVIAQSIFHHFADYNPTLLGLADEDLSAIVSTGGIEPSKIAVTISDNARVTSFIPFDAVLPEVDVFITNGGYGGVQQSLSLGIPVVVAGATDAKSHVAARVAWSGAGLDLATARPTPAQLKSAVREVLNHPKYRIEARRLGQEFATYNALDRIGSRIDTLLGTRYVTS